jgi:hypothetical protein
MTTKNLVAPASLDLDPVAQRAQFFFDLEMAELKAVIPQAKPVDGKLVY